MKSSILTTLCFVCCCFTATISSAQPVPYLDSRLSPEERAADLCARLTIEEKARLLMHYSPAVERRMVR